jgi:hypothetical protein
MAVQCQLCHTAHFNSILTRRTLSVVLNKLLRGDVSMAVAPTWIVSCPAKKNSWMVHSSALKLWSETSTHTRTLRRLSEGRGVVGRGVLICDGVYMVTRQCRLPSTTAVRTLSCQSRSRKGYVMLSSSTRPPALRVSHQQNPSDPSMASRNGVDRVGRHHFERRSSAQLRPLAAACPSSDAVTVLVTEVVSELSQWIWMLDYVQLRSAMQLLVPSTPCHCPVDNRDGRRMCHHLRTWAGVNHLQL